MSRRGRSRRSLVLEATLLLAVVGGFYLLLVSGALADFARWFGEQVAHVWSTR